MTNTNEKKSKVLSVIQIKLLELNYVEVVYKQIIEQIDRKQLISLKAFIFFCSFMWSQMLLSSTLMKKDFGSWEFLLIAKKKLSKSQDTSSGSSVSGLSHTQKKGKAYLGLESFHVSGLLTLNINPKQVSTINCGIRQHRWDINSNERQACANTYCQKSAVNIWRG